MAAFALPTLSQIVTAAPPIHAPIRNGLLLRNDGRHIPLAGDVIDLTVTSPPYGAGIPYDEGGDVPADGWPAFTEAWLADPYRATKRRARRPMAASPPRSDSSTSKCGAAGRRVGWQPVAGNDRPEGG
jgi:hypothetical protein